MKCHVSSRNTVVTKKNSSGCFGIESTLILKYSFLSFAVSDLKYFLCLYLCLRKTAYWLLEVIRIQLRCVGDMKGLFSMVCCGSSNAFIEVACAG